MAASLRKISGVVALLGALAPTLAAGADPGLEIFFIDVMGGAATLLVTPEKESILIDSGWPGLNDRDPKRIVHVLKDVAGLDHLDHMVTTHWHTDHFGGIEGLSKLIQIDNYWDRGLPDPNAADGDSAKFPDGPKPDSPLGKAYLSASEGKRKTLKAGDRFEVGGLIIVVLASGGEVLPAPDDKPNPACAAAPADLEVDNSDNAMSLAFKMSLGRFDFLDCGDLTWNIEKKLVCPTDRIGPVDLYQVTHHGMDISNHPTLLETVAPTVTIMNNGPRKGGAPATVKRLRGLPSVKAAYQLHKNVATSADENTDPALIANPTVEGGEFIRVSVSPDGERFTVKVGENGEGRTFSSR